MLCCSALEAILTGEYLGSLFGAMLFFLRKRRKDKDEMQNDGATKAEIC